MKRYKWNVKRFIGNMLALVVLVALIAVINYMLIGAIIGGW